MFKAAFFALLLCVATVVNAQPKEIRRLVENMIYREAEIDFKLTPAFIVGIIDHDSTYILPFGSLDPSANPPNPPTPRTIFEVGAFTKVFTAMLVAQCVAEGKLALSDTAEKYLNYPLPRKNGKPITIAHLLSHTSGLPKSPNNGGQYEADPQQPYRDYPREARKAFLATFVPTHEAGEHWEYSHLGYDVLGDIVLGLFKTPLTVSSYENALAQLPIQKNRMPDTRILLPTDTATLHRIARGYSLGKNAVPRYEFGETYYAAMGLSSTLADLMHLQRLLVTPHSAVNRLLEPLYATAKKTDRDDITQTFIFQQQHPRHARYNVLLHTGTTQGSRMYFGFVRETQTGVVVLANSATPLNGLGEYILQLLNYNWKRRD